MTATTGTAQNFQHLDRRTLGHLIANRLAAECDALKARWQASQPVQHVIIDNLLPPDLAARIRSNFPNLDLLMQRSSLRERKKVGVELSKYDPMIGAILYAFQQPEVVKIVTEITGVDEMTPDPTLYASGLSAMLEGDFLNPHLDNSHDGDGEHYRVLNLLYYVSPNWKLENGGNLELWDEKITQPTPVAALFNRLVLMRTDKASWHSVNKVVVPEARLCVSNYYFAPQAPGGEQFSHVTTFAGRPEEKMKRALLRVDGAARNIVKKMLPFLQRKSKHRLHEAAPTESEP